MRAFPSRILLATDGSGDAALLAQTARLACRSGSELHVVHAYQDVPTARFRGFVKRELKLQHQELLDRRVSELRDSGLSTVVAHPRKGRTADAVVELARDIGADLVVVGSRGAGYAGRLVLGSVSAELVYRSSRPVLVVPESQPAPMLHTSQEGAGEVLDRPDILIAVEAVHPLSASQYAVRLAETIGAKLFILSVPEETTSSHASIRRVEAVTALARAGEAATAEVTAMATERGVQSEKLLRPGKLHHVIFGVSEEIGAEYIVLGSGRASRLERALPGDVSRKVLRRARRPVLVVGGGGYTPNA